MITQERPLEVQITFKAKTYDIDYAGIVHNAVYIRWLEDLRLQFLAEHHPLEESLALNRSRVLEKTEITYRRPLRIFDEPLGHMWLSDLGKARWEVQAEFTLGDLVIATARQTGYFVDLDTLRPIRIPQTMRDKWENAKT
jgi:acyl-CoA thioester hydrolase